MTSLTSPPPSGIAENPIAQEHYGAKTVAVEPGGVEFIPDSERHGTPRQLLWTWTSPNLEFATIAVGILGPVAFGLTFWQTAVAVVLGAGLGSLSHGVLSSWGPPNGLCQMVLSRAGFGYRGNILPAGLNAVVAGVGWFAVNSVSGALALHALFNAIPSWLCLLIIVVAEFTVAAFGHNLVHTFEKMALPLLGVVFVVGAIIIFGKANLSAPALHPTGSVPGSFIIEAAAAFGYAAGWNPYGADFTRYLPRTTSRRATGLYAGAGVFVSCVILQCAGAAMAFAVAKPDVLPGIYTEVLPTWLGKLTLLCIAVGAVAANALNIYSGAMSALSMGIKLPPHRARVIVASVFGVAGFILALNGLNDAGTKFENFLLVIAYWIAPWLGVVFVDRALRRGQDISNMVLRTDHRNLAGPIAMVVAGVVSVWLFSNQTEYLAPVPKAHPIVGDLTPLVGFILAAVIYAVLYKPLAGQPEAATESVDSRDSVGESA
ncbi:cytosine permease [Dermatophilaceae bacterium Sec6.4]